MKTVILAGGMGTRLGDEGSMMPKPLAEVGGYPILWHVMNLYASRGFKEFYLALGYRGEAIKDFFLSYRAATGDVSINLATGRMAYHRPGVIDWEVHMVDTGLGTMTGGRLARLDQYLRPDGTFLLTYGDGVSDVDVRNVLEFHQRHGRIATVTAVRPPARFGTMFFDGDQVLEFKEKPQTGEGWINGGFFVFEPEIFDYLDGDGTVLEGEPLERLAADGQLMAFKHEGFWACMDTPRDRKVLEALWETAKAPWRVWE